MRVTLTSEMIRNACDHLCFEGEFVSAEPYGSGHINDTFCVVYRKADGNTHRYILQRINNQIFKNPVKLMENIQGVTSFLKEKIVARGGDYTRETLNIIPAKDGKSYFCDEHDSWFRGYIFIEGATTFQIVEDPKDFYNSARAFGKFQNLLADYPAATLDETIVNFHNTVSRFADFKAALAENKTGRADDCKDEIQFVLDREADTHVLVDMLAKGEIPLKVTHNDTKLNNVMIDDASGEGICVIDLDTVMPGSALYDFGDSIRFGASTAAEDEKDLNKVNMDINLYEIYLKGFMETAGDAMTENEIRMLPMGAKLMTLECGMRFLADHIAGDTYFKIHREGHNLDRARTQFKLVWDMERQWDEMCRLAEAYIK